MTTTNLPIKLVEILFDYPIKYEDLSKFRGAVIHTTQQINDLYHNHNGDGLIYRYPRVQYKRICGKAALLCVGEAVDAVHEFFSNYKGTLQIGEQIVNLQVGKINARQHRIQYYDGLLEYRLANWLPLNQDNYRLFQQTTSYSGKMQILERVLIGNLLTFCETFDAVPENPLQAEIRRVASDKVIPYKGQLMQAFDLDIAINITFHDHLGIGKGASLGFGVLTRKWTDQRTNIQQNERLTDQLPK